MNLVEIKSEDVKVVSKCDLLEELIPGYWEEGKYIHYDYETTCKMVDEWANKHNAYVYERCKEDFYIYEAQELAAEEGNTIVVVDNLS